MLPWEVDVVGEVLQEVLTASAPRAGAGVPLR